MNKVSKVAILLGAIVLPVWLVFYFYDKSVSLPNSFQSENQYVPSVEGDIAGIKSASTDRSLDSAFVAVTHELVFLHNNGLITDEEMDKLLDSFADEYVPAFVSSCNRKFEKNVWYEFALDEMSRRVSDLREIKSTNRNPIVKGENKKSIDRVQNIVNDYYKANDVSYTSGYHGKAYAEEKIKEAEKYASMSPIKNCTDLVARLNSVPERLGLAHYQYLKDQVGRLNGYYYNHKEWQFINLYNIVTKELKEYNNMCKNHRTYGDHYKYNHLKELKEKYYDDGGDYYFNHLSQNNN